MFRSDERLSGLFRGTDLVIHGTYCRGVRVEDYSTGREQGNGLRLVHNLRGYFNMSCETHHYATPVCSINIDSIEYRTLKPSSYL